MTYFGKLVDETKRKTSVTLTNELYAALRSELYGKGNVSLIGDHCCVYSSHSNDTLNAAIFSS